MTFGGLVNEAKSKIYSWNINKIHQRKIEEALVFKMVKYQIKLKYLGMSIWLKKASSKSWQVIIDKIKIRKENWGAHQLNLAGKTILSKFVLSIIHLFQLQALMVPRSIIHRLGIQVQKFLWEGGKISTKKFRLVKCVAVRAYKLHKGLAIRDTDLMNFALAEKLYQ